MLNHTVLTSAKLLRSESGENPEYDRALVELCSDLTGMPPEQVRSLIMDDRAV